MPPEGRNAYYNDGVNQGVFDSDCDGPPESKGNYSRASVICLMILSTWGGIGIGWSSRQACITRVGSLHNGSCSSYSSYHPHIWMTKFCEWTTDDSSSILERKDADPNILSTTRNVKATHRGEVPDGHHKVDGANKNKRKNPIKKWFQKIFRKNNRKKDDKVDHGHSMATMSPTKTNEMVLSMEQQQALQRKQTQLELVQKLAAEVRKEVPDWDERIQRVPWGGPAKGGVVSSNRSGENSASHWWHPLTPSIDHQTKRHTSAITASAGHHQTVSSAAAGVVDTVAGGHLLAGYLRIMEFPPNLFAYFPFQLCANGCRAHVALAHSLEFREKYQPWCVTPSVVEENENGWIYHRGHLLEKDEGTSTTTATSVVWFRPGLHHMRDAEAYNRCLIHTLDAAVAEALQHYSNDNNDMSLSPNQSTEDSANEDASLTAVGKYNVVLDCSQVRFSHLPNIKLVKRTFTMMQDHFPDRLMYIMLTNVSGPFKLILKMVFPFVSKEVRDKIIVLPSGNKEKHATMEKLRAVMKEEFIPDWLGGTDEYRFNAEEYYRHAHRCTEEEATAYLNTMPYHA